jgi:hypothetical protein
LVARGGNIERRFARFCDEFFDFFACRAAIVDAAKSVGGSFNSRRSG